MIAILCGYWLSMPVAAQGGDCGTIPECDAQAAAANSSKAIMKRQTAEVIAVTVEYRRTVAAENKLSTAESRRTTVEAIPTTTAIPTATQLPTEIPPTTTPLPTTTPMPTSSAIVATVATVVAVQQVEPESDGKPSPSIGERIAIGIAGLAVFAVVILIVARSSAGSAAQALEDARKDADEIVRRAREGVREREERRKGR